MVQSISVCVHESVSAEDFGLNLTWKWRLGSNIENEYFTCITMIIDNSKINFIAMTGTDLHTF
jgi:hypothetical protein